MSDDDEIPPDVFFCPECGRPATDVKDHLQHIREAHPDHKITGDDEMSEIGREGRHGKRE